MVSALTSLASPPSPDPRMMATCGASDVRRRTTDTARSICCFNSTDITRPANCVYNVYHVFKVYQVYPPSPESRQVDIVDMVDLEDLVDVIS